LDARGHDRGGEGGAVGDEAVVVGFFDPFIDDCARPEVAHLVVKMLASGMKGGVSQLRE
jgi:hypothetical protein